MRPALGLEGREAWWTGVLTLFCVIRPIDTELGNAQANNFVLLCLALMAWAFTSGRKGLAGLALAGAISLKGPWASCSWRPGSCGADWSL